MVRGSVVLASCVLVPLVSVLTLGPSLRITGTAQIKRRHQISGCRARA